MSDRFAQWHLGLGPILVDMDPMPILRQFRKDIDLMLGHKQPVAWSKFSSDMLLQLENVFDNQHGRFRCSVLPFRAVDGLTAQH
jgi:hypothetical protein